MFGWLKRTPVETLTPQDVAGRMDGRSIILVDVREAREWTAGHIGGARHIPLSELGRRLGELPAGKPVVFYCLSGGRSASAVAAAAAAGRSDVAHMGGGITAWRLHGLPVKT